MKTHFKAISTVSFGNQKYDSGYPGFFPSEPKLFVVIDQEFSVEYMYNSTEKVKLDSESGTLAVEIFEIGNYLLQGKIKQVDR